MAGRKVPGSAKGERGRQLRVRLAHRDGACCFYCRRGFPDPTAATLDHYVPYRLWRTWRLVNLVLACEPCNTRKADCLPILLALLLLQSLSNYVYPPGDYAGFEEKGAQP